ncbi:hypothetical protein H2198_008566 [Neophaeococcomyces mojaviensis]|uniref:Uncharacterized protein n=1 Tax=Neophaeococcomyces mojaviensis TaxID=3383035 RepID=A0ACC2ZWW3_9EURO|nr:hypothetical protein H2198_008566 [Knufia sp. JES_112]
MSSSLPKSANPYTWERCLGQTPVYAVWSKMVVLGYLSNVIPAVGSLLKVTSLPPTNSPIFRVHKVISKDGRWGAVVSRAPLAGSLVDNVQLGCTWLVTIAENPRRLSKDSVARLDCMSKDSERPNQSDFEIEQRIGTTNLSLAAIKESVDQLNEKWGTSYDVFWNSQHFAVYFALLIINEKSLEDAVPLSCKLLFKLREAAYSLRVKRHLWCMAGMAVSGLLTFGAGAIASWAAAGGFMVSDTQAEDRAFQSGLRLRQEYEVLKQI